MAFDDILTTAWSAFKAEGYQVVTAEVAGYHED